MKKIEKINFENIEYPKKSYSDAQCIQLMYQNLFLQFNNIPKFCVWTSKAKNEFYSIPFHKKLNNNFKKSMMYIDWIKNIEPIEKLGKRKNETTYSRTLFK